MALYRELTAAAQTAYAELAELVQVAETMRSPASLTGTIGWKTIKGRCYTYWQFKEIDGRKREYYLGPEGPAITAIEQARGGGARKHADGGQTVPHRASDIHLEPRRESGNMRACMS